MAAAASSLKGQAQELVQSVAVFHLAGGAAASHAPPKVAVRAPISTGAPKGVAERRAVAAPAKPRPAAKSAPELPAPAPARAAAPAGGEDDWASF